MRGVVGSLTGADVLADVAVLGRPFVVALGGGGRPLADLAADPSLLRARVLAARDELGTTEDRVAASWVFGGIAARVVAPALAAVALHGWLPDLAALRWRPWTAGIIPPLALPVPCGSFAGPEDAADTLVPALGELVGAVRSRTRVASGLLWGEVAAGAVKASRIVEREHPGAAAPVLAALLDRPPLAPTTHGERRTRRTCCLAYRVPGGRTCAGCPLGTGRGAC